MQMSILQYSFILTMWYVNKEEWATIMEYYKSFILTMWYVNPWKR